MEAGLRPVATVALQVAFLPEVPVAVALEGTVAHLVGVAAAVQILLVALAALVASSLSTQFRGNHAY